MSPGPEIVTRFPDRVSAGRSATSLLSSWFGSGAMPSSRLTRARRHNLRARAGPLRHLDRRPGRRCARRRVRRQVQPSFADAWRWRDDWEIAERVRARHRHATGIGFRLRSRSCRAGPRARKILCTSSPSSAARSRSSPTTAACTRSLGDSSASTSPTSCPTSGPRSALGAVALDPEHGYVFASFAYQDDEGQLHNDIVALRVEAEDVRRRAERVRLASPTSSTSSRRRDRTRSVT